MAELWAEYGNYIILGALVLFMVRMHSRGGGCCGGHTHTGTGDNEEGSRADHKNKNCH